MISVDLETYLHEHIPLTAAMGVRVDVADEDRIVLRAPLAPNINHRQSAFGGSIAALATIAGWSWLHGWTRRRGLAARLVVRTSNLEYLLPITGDLVAECIAPPTEAIDRFMLTLRRRGRARIALSVTVWEGDQVGATFEGIFVALEGDTP